MSFTCRNTLPTSRKLTALRPPRTDFRSDAPRRKLAVEANQSALGGIDGIVARVADDGSGDGGQTHLREQSIDQRFVRSLEAAVEHAGAVDGVASAQRIHAPDSPG